MDIGTLIERDFNGRKHPTMHFLMSANSKSFREIHDELLIARNADIDAVNLTETKRTNFLRLPRFVRKLMLRAMRRDPFVKKFAMGTVGVTAVGMLGAKNHRGWPLPVSPWTLTVAIGAFFRAPAVVEGDRIEARDFLPATLCFDHDIVDGGPAARYTHRLCELIESGFELPEGPTEVVSSVKDNAAPALAAASR